LFIYIPSSLCYAPPDSENLALAYANRSAVYFEMGHYEEALENIELAKAHKYPKQKLGKLKIREEKCLDKMLQGSPAKDKYQHHEKIRSEVFAIKQPGNQKMIGYIADCLEVEYSSMFGRQIVTNRDLKVGTVVAIEEPFVKNLIHSNMFIRCANCLKTNTMNLIPCETCCSTMFCSEECKRVAWEKFHQYECQVADVMTSLFMDKNTIGLRTFFEALSIFNHDPAALKEYLESIENPNATLLDFDFSKMNDFEKKKAMFHSVDSLCLGNPAVSKDGFFIQNFTSTILINLMLNHSTLGSILNKEQQAMFREFVFKYSLICDVNGHNLYCFYEENREVESDEIGMSVFPFTSLLNHSCVPNVSRFDIQSKMYLVVKRPIKAGEQLFDSYG
jgi:hypothetical protein